MAKDRLIVVEDRNGYRWRICWWLADEQEEGAVLGDRLYSEAELQRASPDDWEHVMAVLVAGKCAGVERDSGGYYWEVKSHATGALKIIKAALYDKSRRPWPQWALEAKAAGWTPPPGWSP